MLVHLILCICIDIMQTHSTFPYVHGRLQAVDRVFKLLVICNNLHDFSFFIFNGNWGIDEPFEVLFTECQILRHLDKMLLLFNLVHFENLRFYFLNLTAQDVVIWNQFFG